MKNNTDISIHNGRAVAVCLIFSFIGPMYILLLPLFVGTAAVEFGFTESQLGILASCILAGLGISAAASIFWVRKVPWRRAMLACCIILLSSQLASLLVEDFAIFSMLQGIACFGGGSMFSLVLTILSDHNKSDKLFGYLVAAQVSFQVLGLWLLPSIVQHSSMTGILLIFICLSTVGALLVWWLPDRGREVDSTSWRGGHKILERRSMFSLFGCFLFFANVGCIWTYVERIGTVSGLSGEHVGQSLAAGTLVGVFGGLLASWWGDRLGRLLPLGIGAIGTVIAIVLLYQPVSPMSFILAAAIYSFAWNLSLAYQYSVVEDQDSSGRMVALVPAFHGIGGAAGSAFAARFVSQESFQAVNNIAIVLVLASFLLFFLSQYFTLKSKPVKLDW